MWLITTFKDIYYVMKQNKKNSEQKTEAKKNVPEEKILTEDEAIKLVRELREVESKIIQYRKNPIEFKNLLAKKTEIINKLRVKNGTATTTKATTGKN